MKAPHISRPVLRFFRHIVRGYFRRHFRAVWISRADRLIAAAAGGKTIVYANHSSWWDPMVQVLLGGELLPARRHYAPMDSEALDRYAIFKKLGVFGVEMNTPRGAAQFLRTSLKVLAEDGVLWITPQGRFADARERPLNFKPGLGALASRVDAGCTLIPLAIEYTFWDERLPEALLHIGEPVSINGESAIEIDERLKAALTEAMDELKDLACRRDPGAFQLLRAGRTGTGGFYEMGQRFVARLRGRRFQAEHTAHHNAVDEAR